LEDFPDFVDLRFCAPRFGGGLDAEAIFRGSARAGCRCDLGGIVASGFDGSVSGSAPARRFGGCSAGKAGSLEAKRRGGSRSPLEGHAAVLLTVNAEKPDLTLDEFCAELLQRKIATGSVSLWRFFARPGISFKKSCMPASSSVLTWRRPGNDQASLDPSRLVFIDETGTSTTMARRRGRSSRGPRLIGYVPHGHWKITTFVATLCCNAIMAPFVIDRPMNGPIFTAYVTHCLMPTLTRRHRRHGQSQAPQGQGCRQGDRSGQHQGALPAAYSPDLNPIERFLAKMKTLLRKAAERTTEDLWNRIGKLLDAFSPPEYANYFRHEGYVEK
jgi:transposase